jgi:hypothetical protein
VQRFIDKIIYEGFSIVALGATTFKNGNCNFYTGVMDAYFDDRISLKYLDLKYDGLHYILSLYSKKSFFDYSLGGYSHRER